MVLSVLQGNTEQLLRSGCVGETMVLDGQEGTQVLLSWPPSTACGPRLSQMLRLETDVHPVPKRVKDPGECEIEPGRRRLLLAAELVQCAKVTACLALWGPAYHACLSAVSN
ncbi:hypothetical protein SRHO_G00148790 [Serrasalmus rhombeus]